MTDLDGAVTINESSADADFRVESDNDTHALFVNGADGNVGIGATPASWASTWEVLQVGAKGAVTSQNGDVLQLSENTYHDGSNWKAVGTDAASLVYLDGGLTIFYHAPSVSADANQTWSEKMRVTSNGLTFNGDTAAANALDDYEEGTFTPAIQMAGGGTGTISYDSASGQYTIVGNTVHFNIFMGWNIATSAGSGNFEVTGLPVAASSTTAHRHSTVCSTYNIQYDSTGSGRAIASEGVAGGTKFLLLRSLSNAAWATVTATEMKVGEWQYIRCTGHYKV